MLRRIAGPLALLFAVCLASAQSEIPVKINFGSEGEREVWTQQEGNEGNVPDTKKVSGKAVEISVPSDSSGLNVYVHDVATGNVVVKPLIDVVRDGEWTVQFTQASHTYLVAFDIQHIGKPVASAVVHLTFEDGSRQQLLTPSDNGVVVFNTVPLGDISVTVDYKTEGDNRSLGAQVFEVKRDMATQAPYVLTIDDTVETVAAPTIGDETPASEKTEPAEEDEKAVAAPETNIGLKIIQFLMGLLVIGGISYAIWRTVKANPDQTEDMLRKAGVPVGSDPASSQPGAVAHQKPGPPQQIILDGSTPPPAAATPTTAGTPAVSAPISAVKNPRLVKSDGSISMVMDGENSVGRDEGLQISIEGESSISRNHAQLVRTDDSVVVQDLGSTNGTFVNGTKITSEVTLSPGDSVQFGAVQYRYEE